MGTRNQARNATKYLYEKQDGKCFYCDSEMFLMENSDKKYRKLHMPLLATFDHIKLKSEGGTYARINGVCACFKCNGMRGDLPQDVFIEHFDYIASEWDKGNRTPRFLPSGELICIPSKKYNRIKKKVARQKKNLPTVGFIIARYAMQIGKTVEDLFLENMYNSTYELVRDL